MRSSRSLRQNVTQHADDAVHLGRNEQPLRPGEAQACERRVVEPRRVHRALHVAMTRFRNVIWLAPGVPAARKLLNKTLAAARSRPTG